jgi:competence protein ComEC
MPVGRIETGEPERIRERLPEAPQPVLPCRRRRETLGGFDLLFWHSRHAQRGNDASCVLIVRHRASGVEWVLPGDLTVTTEQEFLRDDVLQESPTYRIVIAPHHGSKTSSSPAWVTHLAPNLVVYSAGYRHRFGHPHPSVTVRYRAVGATALNTACSGSLTFSVAAEGLDIVEARSRAPFWISAPGLARSQCGQP